MDFKENFCFAYVSDNLQHFSKFDLFDLCDLHFRSRSKICDARKIALMYHIYPLNVFSIPLKLIKKSCFHESGYNPIRIIALPGHTPWTHALDIICNMHISESYTP